MNEPVTGTKAGEKEVAGKKGGIWVKLKRWKLKF
jgi:hypothetical protein